MAQAERLMKGLTRLHASLALLGMTIAVGEQVYNRYMTLKRKRRRRKNPFGFSHE